MNLPQLTELATVKDNTEQFAGYNHNLRNSVGEWYDQHNMTTDYYPVASPRDKRSLQTMLKDMEIIFDINEDNPLLFDLVYAKGCCALGYTDKMLISLQQIYDKENNPIGTWFTNDGELVALNHIYPVYELKNVNISTSTSLKTITNINSDGSVTIERKPFIYFNFTGDDIKNTNISEGDEVSFFISDMLAVTNGKKLNGLVTYVGENCFTIDIEGTIDNSFNKTSDAVIINSTKQMEFMKKAACFDVSDNSTRVDGRKRSIVRMGSYICVMPDGVIYETANKKDDIPVFSVSEKTDYSNVTFKTVVKADDTKLGYSPIVLFANSTDGEENYRIMDNAVQYYISGTNMWVSATTYVMIYVENQTGTFDSFNVNDVLNIKNNGQMPEKTLKGLLTWNSQKKEYTEKSLKIIEKGTLAVGQMDVTKPTDYIIVDGYICQTWFKNIDKEE
ncbi:MAG: hypothetical protein NC213_09930 [Acetobacter sp.]|nr:hypothetical protein [Bacteroides sp.]MCM1342051.1 hypothetical protein [Acetobacter sp.]MCM1434263.1 hypothetical protein [Clostridiales bacterium]